MMSTKQRSNNFDLVSFCHKREMREKVYKLCVKWVVINNKEYKRNERVKSIDKSYKICNDTRFLLEPRL